MALWVLAFVVFSKKTTDLPDPCRPKTSDIKSVIISKACYNHIDPDLLVRIAKCESGLNPNAKNKHSTASGLFQWLDSSFTEYALAYEIPLDKKNDPEVQAELSAKVISNGGLHNWIESKNCWNK